VEEDAIRELLSESPVINKLLDDMAVMDSEEEEELKEQPNQAYLFKFERQPPINDELLFNPEKKK
jgi:hypothetical protein